jgi:excisionase family DNA binding protein
MTPPSDNATPQHASPAKGEPLLLRAGQVAELLNCSVRLVWRLASEGRLPRVHLGPRCVRFRRSDVESLVDDLVEG